MFSKTCKITSFQLPSLCHCCSQYPSGTLRTCRTQAQPVPDTGPALSALCPEHSAVLCRVCFSLSALEPPQMDFPFHPRTFIIGVYKLAALHSTQLVCSFPAGILIPDFQQASPMKSLSVWLASGGSVLIHALGEEVN